MNEPNPSRGMSDYFRTVLACVATTLLTLPLHGAVDAANIVMIFLLAVALVAVWLGSAADFFGLPPNQVVELGTRVAL